MIHLNLSEFFGAMENVRVDIDKRHSIQRGTETLYPVYIVLYSHNETISKVIKKLTHQPYSHASISFDSSMHSMYTFGNKMVYNERSASYKHKFGAGRESFVRTEGKWSYPPETPYAIYVLFLPKENIDRMKKRIHEIFNQPEAYRYSYDGLVKYYLGISSESTYKMFCSQFVASLLLYGGYTLDRLPSLYSPYELKDIQNVIFVEDGIIKQFNRDKFIKKMDRICSDYLEDMENIGAD